MATQFSLPKCSDNKKQDQNFKWEHLETDEAEI